MRYILVILICYLLMLFRLDGFEFNRGWNNEDKLWMGHKYKIERHFIFPVVIRYLKEEESPTNKIFFIDEVYIEGIYEKGGTRE